MNYVFTLLKEEFKIDKIVTVHYFEYSANFAYYGEYHDFWEFLYVDKGVVEVVAGDDVFTLCKDEVIFHKPNEFHNVRANGKIAPNLIVVSFECLSPSMKFFENRILKITSDLRSLLGKLIKEARKAFLNDLNDTFYTQLKRNKNAEFGSEQMIKVLLQQFLLLLYRLEGNSNYETQKKSLAELLLGNIEQENKVFKKVVSYMEDNISSTLTVKSISQANLISESYIQKIFKKNTSIGVIAFFSKMKIEKSKIMIRIGDKNFTEISRYLGYSSVHYFSRQFKNITGITPTEYANSLL